MKRVLVITYYWPPSGGAGVQRWLKMVKYLREFGWEPIVFTADNAAYPITDPTLEKDIPDGIEVWKQPIWEPYEWYKKFTGRKKSEQVFSGFMQDNNKKSWKDTLALWIRSNIFIPDARKYWIKPSVKFLKDKLKQHPVELIVSTGPPHSAHLIAMGVKENIGIPWIADFRDPWTKIDYFHHLKLTRAAAAKHHQLELKVLQTADVVECVSWHWADDFEKMSDRKVAVITNGYDETDFEAVEIKPIGKFTLSHIGSITAERNHPALWRALQTLCEAHADFKQDFELQLIGKNDALVYKQIEQHHLSPHLNRLDYVPHSRVPTYQCNASVLLLPLGNIPSVHGLLPGKLFEYIASHRPILVIGPEDGDCAKIVRETNSGVCCNFEDEEKMKTQIFSWYQSWKENQLHLKQTNIEQYTRRNIAHQMAALFNTIVP